MDPHDELLAEIRSALEGPGELADKAGRVADLIRSVCGYRWVGIYKVSRDEIAVLAWSGPNGPAVPRFPVNQGLCGAAVRSRAAVIVSDVTKDLRYLTTLDSTRSEIVVPVLNPATKAVLGVLDVESERLNAFTEEDRGFLEKCASALSGLYSGHQPFHHF
jgi:L-methionine (R)-S-oxide reductase